MHNDRIITLILAGIGSYDPSYQFLKIGSISKSDNPIGIAAAVTPSLFSNGTPARISEF
jgi:hypothetical protein